jgi:hypothetical protein
MTHAHIPSVPLAQLRGIGDVDLLKYARSIVESAVLELEGWFFRPVTREQPLPLAWHPDLELDLELVGAAGGVLRLWGVDIRLRVIKDERGEVVDSEEYEEVVYPPIRLVRRQWGLVGFVGDLGQFIEYRPAGAEDFEEVLSHYKLDQEYAPYDLYAHGGFEFVRFL